MFQTPRLRPFGAAAVFVLSLLLLAGGGNAIIQAQQEREEWEEDAEDRIEFLYHTPTPKATHDSVAWRATWAAEEPARRATATARAGAAEAAERQRQRAGFWQWLRTGKRPTPVGALPPLAFERDFDPLSNRYRHLVAESPDYALPGHRLMIPGGGFRLVRDGRAFHWSPGEDPLSGRALLEAREACHIARRREDSRVRELCDGRVDVVGYRVGVDIPPGVYRNTRGSHIGPATCKFALYYENARLMRQPEFLADTAIGSSLPREAWRDWYRDGRLPPGGMERAAGRRTLLEIRPDHALFLTVGCGHWVEVRPEDRLLPGNHAVGVSGVYRIGVDVIPARWGGRNDARVMDRGPQYQYDGPLWAAAMPRREHGMYTQPTQPTTGFACPTCRFEYPVTRGARGVGGGDLTHAWKIHVFPALGAWHPTLGAGIGSARSRSPRTLTGYGSCAHEVQELMERTPPGQPLIPEAYLPTIPACEEQLADRQLHASLGWPRRLERYLQGRERVAASIRRNAAPGGVGRYADRAEYRAWNSVEAPRYLRLDREVQDWGRYYPESERERTYYYTPDRYPAWYSRNFDASGG